MSDIITKEHRVQSDFANTGLEHQPKEHGIKKIVILAMVANSCMELPGFGMEPGTHLRTPVACQERRRSAAMR